MLTNYSGLETILEQRCSSSHFFLYYNKAGTNLVTDTDDANFKNGLGNWEITLGAAIAHSSNYSISGSNSGKIAQTACGGLTSLPLSDLLADNTVYVTIPNRRPAADKWTLKLVHSADPSSFDEGTTVDSVDYTTANSAWGMAKLSGAIPSGVTGIYIIAKCTDLGGLPRCIYLDNIRVSTVGHLNWSDKFFDVNEDEAGLATEFGSMLTGKFEWGETNDPTVIGPYRAWTTKLTFTFKDTNSTIDNWTRRGTGIMLSAGVNSSSTYAQQTRCFHGIIWDWTIVNGEADTYQVTCYGLGQLWKDYKVGSEALDSPNAFGIIEDTITTDPRKKFYAIPSPTEPKFVYKARYEGADINRNNIAVAKFFNGESGEINLLSLMLPLETNLTCIAQYFEGKNYSDVIEHFESNLTIAQGMPANYRGHTGDTLTATNGPWAHFGNSESAWKQLSDSVGVKLYGFYYNENGQITIIKPDVARAASGVTRGTSESDQSKAGQIVTFENIDNDGLVNDPAIEITKYGVDSSQGHSVPNIDTATYEGQKTLLIPNAKLSMISAIATPATFIPMMDSGDYEVNDFDDTLTIATYPTAVTSSFEADVVANGTVVVDGSGSCEMVAPSVADASFIELDTAETYSSFKLTTKVNIDTGGTFEVRVATAKGANQDWKCRVLFNASGQIKLQTHDGTDIWQPFRTLVGGSPTGYVQQSWHSATTTDYYGQWTATNDYWVTIEKFGSSFDLRVCDGFFLPVTDSNTVYTSVGLIVDTTTYMRSGDNHVQIGNLDASTTLAGGKVRFMTYNAPQQHDIVQLVTFPYTDSIYGNETDYNTLDIGYAQGQNPYYITGKAMGINLDGSYDRVEGVVSHDSEPTAIYCKLIQTGAPFQPEVHSIFTASSTQTAIDSSTTVSDSQVDNGYQGLKEGTWNQRWLWSDAAAQDLANKIAEMNLEDREPIKIQTKFNPKYKPGDIIEITYFSKITSQKYEIAGTSHSCNLDLSGGGAKTILTLRKWTA